LNTTTAKLFIWVGGSDEINQNGIYGEKGIPDENNIPGGRAGAVTWIDSSNNFCLFGGRGYRKTGKTEGI